jgi:hypothetical protein
MDKKRAHQGRVLGAMDSRRAPFDALMFVKQPFSEQWPLAAEVFQRRCSPRNGSAKQFKCTVVVRSRPAEAGPEMTKRTFSTAPWPEPDWQPTVETGVSQS